MGRTPVARLCAVAALASVFVVASLVPRAAVAREYRLDLSGALSLARERAPAAVAARARVDEARARRLGASVLLPADPEVELQAGPRFLGGSHTTDVQAGVSQSFELGGRRGARVAGADAAIAAAQASAEDTLRLVLRDVALAFYRALATEERVQLATSVEASAAELVGVAEKRRARGELVALEVNLARAAAARARSARHAAEADREVALGELCTRLALAPGDTCAVTGPLSVRRDYALETLLGAARRRPDLGVLAAERAAGEAEVRLGEGAAWPEVRVGVSYAREEQADIVRGGLSFSLPFTGRGREQRAVGGARAARAANEQAGLARAIDAEVRAGLAGYEQRVAAVEAYERDVIPLVEENEALLQKGFAAGQMGLADYLVARRELLDARREYLERRLELAEAQVALESAAGVLR